MKVLVCGGRDYAERDSVFAALDALHRKHGISVVIHGAASGADSLAEAWAKDRSVPTQAFPAGWDRYGKAAGPIRNRLMLDQGKPDCCVAFPGGRGTRNMVDLAEEAGNKVWQVGVVVQKDRCK